MQGLVDTPYGPVAVIIPGGGVPRFSGFEMDLERLKVPNDSMLGRARISNPARNRNTCIRLFKEKAAHYLFIDDDQGFSEDTLLGLLKHEKPVVSALVSYKMPPFAPVVIKGMRKHPITQRMEWQIYPWAELDGKTGLLEVTSVGTGCLLVSGEVMNKLKDPWFELGRYDAEEMHEDMYFAEKVRKAGFKMYVDLETPIGHWDACAVWPTRLPDGRWTVSLKWENEETVLMGRQDSPVSAQDEVQIHEVSLGVGPKGAGVKVIQ